MRVGISLLSLAAGDAGGSGSPARQLVRALGSVGTFDYVVFVPAGEKDAAGKLTAVDVRDDGRAAPRSTGRFAARALTRLRSRRVQAKVERVDVVHYALTSREPGSNAPSVVTLHDVQHRGVPDFFGPARRSFRSTEYDRAVRSADAVVVATEFVRRRAIDLLELVPSRVHAIQPGVNHTVYRPGEDEREPFILYPARPWPHKNHARLFEAFASLRKNRRQLKLVLVGDGLERLAPLPDGVERWGVVPAAELASLYRRAACLVYPSLYDGFATPPLQAMACGCPVAAADAGALPEICDGSAVLFDPLDPEAMAEAILETDDRRSELRELGLERAAAFTWDESARRHDEVYRSLA